MVLVLFIHHVWWWNRRHVLCRNRYSEWLDCLAARRRSHVEKMALENLLECVYILWSKVAEALPDLEAMAKEKVLLLLASFSNCKNPRKLCVWHWKLDRNIVIPWMRLLPMWND